MLHEAGYSHLTNWPMGLKLKEDSTGGQEFSCCHGDKPYEQKDKFQNYILKYTATAYIIHNESIMLILNCWTVKKGTCKVVSQLNHSCLSNL